MVRTCSSRIRIVRHDGFEHVPSLVNCPMCVDNVAFCKALLPIDKYSKLVKSKSSGGKVPERLVDPSSIRWRVGARFWAISGGMVPSNALFEAANCTRLGHDSVASWSKGPDRLALLRIRKYRSSFNWAKACRGKGPVNRLLSTIKDCNLVNAPT